MHVGYPVFVSDIQHINEQSKISNDGQGLKKIQKIQIKSNVTTDFIITIRVKRCIFHPYVVLERGDYSPYIPCTPKIGDT